MRILIFCMLLSLSSFAQQADEYKSVYKIADMEKSGHKGIMNRDANTLLSFNIDVKYYRCEWQVDPAIRYIKGKVTVYYVPVTNISLLVLDMMADLHTDSVTQRGALLAFTQPGNTIQMSVPLTAAGTLDSVSIYYQGVPPDAGFGSFVQTTHAGVPVMWSLSEPYGSRDWWPCKNGLDDKADSIDVFITAPTTYKAASNGLRQSETLTGGGTEMVTHWKHRYPIASYLLCFAVTNYTVFNNAVQLGQVNLPMVTYCYPENLAAFQAGTQNTLDAMQLYNNHFGEYPFINEKYGHVQFGWGGGMEHQTSTFIVNASEALVAHELGHQWFGDKITCASWEDVWLNEGFATYLAMFYMENKYPAQLLSNRQSIVENITSIPNGSVKVNDTTDVNRIFSGRLSYNKGSYLLNMLRFKLGDSAFFKGLQHYQADPAVAYGFARTADLQRNLEEVSGQDLTNFFNQWFTGQGYPSYHVQWSQVGSATVKIKLSQVTSDPSVAFFELPVALKFKNATQEKTIIADNKSNGEEFIEELGFKPDSVIIDPDYWLITKNNTVEKVQLPNSGIPGVTISPNPLQGPVTIYLHDFSQPAANMVIYNMAGQLIYKRQVTLINGAEIISLHADQFPRGEYVLKVIAGDFKYTRQLLK